MSWVLRGSSNPFMTHDKERNGFSLNGVFSSRGKLMTGQGNLERGVAAVCRTFWVLKNKQVPPCFGVFRQIAQAMISFASGDTEKIEQLRQEISDFAETNSIGSLLSDFLVQVTEQFTCFDDAQLVSLADIVLDLIEGVPFECHQAVERVFGSMPTVKFCRTFGLEHNRTGVMKVVFAHHASLRADADEHGDELATSAATSRPVMETVS